MPSADSTRVHRGPRLQPFERDTLTKILLRALDDFPDIPAMLVHRGGAWQAIGRPELETRIARLAAALGFFGVRAGDRVALLSENRPEWAIADFATLALGAAGVPIYATLPPRQIAYIMRHSGARILFVSTAEQLAKVLEVRLEIPTLERIIVFDEPGDVPAVDRLEDVLEVGRVVLSRPRAPDLRARARAVRPDDLATLVYTSGTTGQPKGVMLTHANLAYMIAATRQSGAFPVGAGDVALSFLPLSHVFERAASYVYWDSGATIAYSRGMESIAADILETRPHVMVAVPRLFEKIHTRLTTAGGARGRLVRWAAEAGGRVVDARLAGRTVPLPLRLRHAVADRLVFSRLRRRLGGRLRVFISGGAPLSADVARFFLAAGVTVHEGYGLTETAPVLAANGGAAGIRLGTVGKPYVGVELRIGERGEILARSPGVMKGYWNDPAATAEALEPDGWLHTGDIGSFDEDGYLRITDRLKGLIVTAGGKNIAPQPIELQALSSPYVAQAVMIGDRRPFPVMLVVPDWERLREWAREHGIEFADRLQLADRLRLVRDVRIRELFDREVLGRLEGLARFEMPKKLSILAEELTIDAGMLTPSLKVIRRAVEQRYCELIEQLYAEPAPA